MLKNVLSYSAKWFVLIFIGSALLWYYIFANVTKPAPTDSIEFFITAKTADCAPFEETIAKSVDAEKITVFFRDDGNEYYESILSTSGLYADLVILSTEYFDNPTTALNFAPIGEDILLSYGFDPSPLKLIKVKDNENPMGVVVFDKKENIDLFKGLIAFDENKSYALCLSVNKPNAKPYSSGEETTDKGYKALVAVLALAKTSSQEH